MTRLGVDDLHRLREQIDEAEKSLTPRERSERLHQETAAYLKRIGLKLQHVTAPANPLHD